MIETGSANSAGSDGYMTVVSSLLEHIAYGIDIIGVLIILYGFVVSLWGFFVSETERLKGGNGILGCMRVRRELGVYILTGIEFMIASDIVHTVLSRELESLYFVAALVVIRTAISFFLGRELMEVAAQVSQDDQPASSKSENGSRETP
jgi:uncharacterized membrane protein